MTNFASPAPQNFNANRKKTKTKTTTTDVKDCLKPKAPGKEELIKPAPKEPNELKSRPANKIITVARLGIFRLLVSANKTQNSNIANPNLKHQIKRPLSGDVINIFGQPRLDTLKLSSQLFDQRDATQSFHT